MCGFFGVLTRSHKQTTNYTKLTKMLVHRGPDEGGEYIDDHLYFGFRRLSIIDIDNGSQPLSFANERYWIVFNGEIYNYIELKKTLLQLGKTFNTNSDTEVLIALYSIYKEKMVNKLRGMFAFVIWDKQEQTIFAARDPFGIKPFYYCEQGSQTFFSSEKKTILAATKHFLNKDALQHYLSFQYVPTTATLSKNIFQLEPGSYLQKKLGDPIKITTYWKPTFSPSFQSLTLAKNEIVTSLRNSVQLHMRSDVPVGSFLSGGIDSTAIACLAKEINPKLKTFTVAFENEQYSELAIAEKTAELLKLEHHSTTVTAEEFIEELPKIIWHLDDPVADPSVVPLYFLAKKAATQVKVVLSGEGADELFGGYNIYREPQALKGFSYLPTNVKKGLSTLANILPDGIKGKNFIQRGCLSIEERYIGNAKIYSEVEKLKFYKHYNPQLHYTDVTKTLFTTANEYDDITKMQFIDIHTWLRGDILTKADRMTMAHSLELRVPFLDKEVFQVAAKLHPSLKVTKATTKYALREALKDLVPEHVVNRKKLGFPVPIRVWLKDHLYDWAVDTILASQTDHLFHKDYLLKLVEDHALGKGDFSRKIWTILTFMIWHRINIEETQQNPTYISDMKARKPSPAIHAFQLKKDDFSI